jgi:SAM-dependent methyltransferase
MTVPTDPFAQFKEDQKQRWANFVPLEVHTTPTAARLIEHAGVAANQHVLDVACGTGVAAITAARKGARVTGLDLTPQLLERARENAKIAELEIDWREGDAEHLPFDSASFSVRNIVFDRDRMLVPALSVRHHRANFERTAGPVIKLIEVLAATDPARLSNFRREIDQLTALYFRDNVVHQDYLLTRATKI